MVKTKLSKNWILNAIIFLLCFLPVAVSFFLATNGKITAIRFHDSFHEIGLPCVFKSATGYNCPSCGMTRSFVYMSHLNLSDAWNMNKAGVLLYFFCLIQIPYRLVLIFREKIPFQKTFMVYEGIHLSVTGIFALTAFILQFI